MGKLFLFLSFFLFQIHVSAKLLVLEVEDLSETTAHAQDVMDIACRNIKNDDCLLLKGADFLFEEYYEFKSFLTKSKVANMSLGFQRPFPKPGHHQSRSKGPTYAELLEEFYERSEVFHEMIDTHSETLFVAAAGNGYNLGMATIKSLAISEKHPIFPAMYQHSNLVTVTSLTSKKVILDNVEEEKIADYANYSLLNVELAAPVETNFDEEELRGTSFAAPYVSRLAYQLLKQNPALRPTEVKEILMKSSFVINPERALEVTQDWIEHGADSLLARQENADNLIDREKLIQEMGPIMLVKSGGPLVAEVAVLCENFHRRTGMTISESCLLAQNKVFGLNQKQLKKIEKLWKLRQF